MNNLSPTLAANAHMENDNGLTTDCFNIRYFTCHGKDKTQNEDTLLVQPVSENGIILAVADGVGSASNAQQASAQLLKTLSKQLATLTQNNEKNTLDKVRNIILDTISNSNKTMSSKAGFLTTITICAIHNRMIQVFQIGDSGLLICGQRGKLKYKTTAHSPVGYALESGMINATQAIHHPENHLVDNLIGTEVANIEMNTPIRLTDHDTVFLATDGLFDNITPEDIIETIRKGKIEKISKTMADCIQNQRTPVKHNAFIKDDDCSFIICRLTS